LSIVAGAINGSPSYCFASSTLRKKLLQRINTARDRGSDAGIIDRLLVSAYERYRSIKARIKAAENPHASRAFLKARRLKRRLKGKEFNFVSVKQASEWTLDWVRELPERYDVVVGVPRSGMFIASLIALKLGRPLTTPELLCRGEFWHSRVVKDKLPLEAVRHILLVDDSIDTGRAMSRAEEQLRALPGNIRVSKACLIVRSDKKHDVDLYYKLLEPPRVFEWNILHRKIASYFGHGVLAVDMDGVLCADCPPGTDDDEPRYLEWLATARPYLIPAFEIDAIVTCRLEKYRPQTVEWLERHEVKYKELRMWNVDSKADRQGKFARHKIDELLRIKPDMFWESTAIQSEKIWSETRIPTLCIDEMVLFS